MNSNRNSMYRTSEGGYIFISHSHLDIKQVRIIRNTLEEEGYEPLCFYLKCLRDDDEVEGLIKREIDSRDIFIYIESKNSKESKWVNKEREYISTCKNKTIYKISLDDDIDLKEETLKILNKTRVYFSYSHHDKDLFNILKSSLINKDLKVLSDVDISPSIPFIESIQNMIREAIAYGCYIVLISEASLKSKFILHELEVAFNMDSDGLIIPILVGDVALNNTLKYYLSTYQHIHISTSPTEEEIDNITSIIKDKLNKKNI